MSNKPKTLTQENYIATKEAAFLLNISVVRLRQLLQQGRVKGPINKVAAGSFP